IKNARLFFEITDALNYPPNKIMLVLNKMDKRSGITAQMIEDNIRHPVAAQIPLDEVIVLNSINRGVPFMMDARTKPIAQALQQLAELLVNEFDRPIAAAAGGRPEEEAARKKTGLFSR
ncbi:MAG TPA: hypothetical protein VII92_04055, partial [Anaerolineae bacterium]